MDALTAGLIVCGGLLAYKGTKMATAKKVTKAKAKAEVCKTGEIVTKFGTFQIGADGVITQTVYPKDVAKHTGNMTAEDVEAEIRRQA